MIQNYFNVAWRIVLRNKSYSLLNITGLAVGIAVTMLIGLWIWEEFSFEKYNPNYERIARVMQYQTFRGETSAGSGLPMPLATELRTTYGNAFKYVAISSWSRDQSLSYGDNKFIEKGKFMEPDGAEILALKMLEGTRAGLKDPSSILLAESTAKKLFDASDPINKVIKIDNRISVTVKGVYEDLPHNTAFKGVAFLAPLDIYPQLDDWIRSARTNWNDDAVEILVQLEENANINDVSSRIRDSKFNKIKNDKEAAAYKPSIFLQPMSRWHLYADFENGVNSGRIRIVWWFSIIGSFILLLACINFMNLSTARSEKRAKEVGIRKTLGSLRRQLVMQFFNESLLTVMLAFGVALVFVVLALPSFNKIAGNQMTIAWRNPFFWSISIVYILGTALVAGSYPAIYLSGFKPVNVLKSAFRPGRLAAIPRKALVVLQFTASLTLIIGTVIVYRQIQYAKDRPVGYRQDGLIAIKMTTPDFFGKEEALRADLLRTGSVFDMAESSSPTTDVWYSFGGFDWKGKDPTVPGELGVVSVTYGYGKTVSWQLKDGRDFSSEFSTDSSGLVLNAAAVSLMGLKKPVGEQIKWGGRTYKVVGVIRNMLTDSPYGLGRPTVYYLARDHSANFMFIKINPAHPIRQALNDIQRVLQKYAPSAPFDYRFVDQEFAKKFADEERIGQIASLFAVLAVFISCLGVFGMASFMAEQRRKEIGVRKVLGASVFNLWALLSKDFVMMVIISLLIATPTAYFIMHTWLNNYPYRSGIPGWIFAAAGFATLMITLCTISIQVIKAALANPIRNLRTE